jgi:hypothetical protein
MVVTITTVAMQAYLGSIQPVALRVAAQPLRQARAHADGNDFKKREDRISLWRVARGWG